MPEKFTVFEVIAHTKGFIEPAIDPENRAELHGIADGMTAAGVPMTYDEIVTHNAEMELCWYWWPLASKKLTDGIDVVKRPKQPCSSFIATGRMAKDGGCSFCGQVGQNGRQVSNDN